MAVARQRGVRLICKRVGDLAFVLVTAIVWVPLLLATAVFVRLTLGAPILFRQRRPGRDGHIFTLLKFRTMTDARDAFGHVDPDNERLTRAGRFLRSWSLDELPELWNVLRGDMSLVGPRPLRQRYLARYSPRQRMRHDVLPGLTGWAQINGRNELSWDTRLEMDVWYAEHWSLWLDLRILAFTVLSVLRRDGISQPGQATSEEFRGASTK